MQTKYSNKLKYFDTSAKADIKFFKPSSFNKCISGIRIKNRMITCMPESCFKSADFDTTANLIIHKIWRKINITARDGKMTAHSAINKKQINNIKPNGKGSEKVFLGISSCAIDGELINRHVPALELELCRQNRRFICERNGGGKKQNSDKQLFHVFPPENKTPPVNVDETRAARPQNRRRILFDFSSSHQYKYTSTVEKNPVFSEGK